jgi:hypothetical protein
VLTLVQKLLRKEGRGEKALALLPRLLGGHSRGSLSAGAGVLAAVVVVVSLLTWLAPDSDRPLPLELVDRVLPGAAEQVEEQAAALIEGGKEAVQSVVQNVREGVVGAGLRAAQDAIPGGSSALFPAVLPTPSSTPTPSPSSEEPSTPSEPQAPAMDSPPPATPSEPSVPSTEAPPAPSEPVTPPPIVEEPSPPAVDEPAPPTEESPPPAAEEPPPAMGEPPTGTPS